MQYQTSKGMHCGFEGWKPDESPLDFFDRGDYLQCMHGVMLCLHLIAQPTLLAQSVEDDGILHELVHLSLNVRLPPESAVDRLKVDLRRQIIQLMDLTDHAVSGGEYG